MEPSPTLTETSTGVRAYTYRAVEKGGMDPMDHSTCDQRLLCGAFFRHVALSEVLTYLGQGLTALRGQDVDCGVDDYDQRHGVHCHPEIGQLIEKRAKDWPHGLA